MFTKLKTFSKLIVYFIIAQLLKPSKEINQKSLLLIRLDDIGDYVLFRNFIEILKKSEQYRDYSITLLGSSVWASLSEELDKEFVDNFIWIDKKKFTQNFIYRYKKLNKITSQAYEVILNTVYSRDFIFSDAIVNVVYAKEKIGSIGDLSNIRQWQKDISDKYYTKLVNAQNELMFEFDRNKEFFENFLHVKLNIVKAHINLKEKKLSYELPKKYAILFIGASTSYRKWSIEGFAKVGEYLKEKHDYDIVLCGASSDADDALKFRKYFSGKYIDLVGKTSLIELLYVIHKGNLMIANETSAPHLAIALEMTNVFVISNGNHYGRFTPYPQEVSENYHVIYHPEIEKDLEDYAKLSNSYGYGSKLNINEISVKSVENKIKEILND